VCVPCIAFTASWSRQCVCYDQRSNDARHGAGAGHNAGRPAGHQLVAESSHPAGHCHHQLHQAAVSASPASSTPGPAAGAASAAAGGRDARAAADLPGDHGRAAARRQVPRTQGGQTVSQVLPRCLHRFQPLLLGLLWRPVRT